MGGYAVTVQHRWMDTQPVVAIAVGGFESCGPGLVARVIDETHSAVDAVSSALEEAHRRGLAVDLETEWTYGDWEDPTALGTGYSAEWLTRWALERDERDDRIYGSARSWLLSLCEWDDYDSEEVDCLDHDGLRAAIDAYYCGSWRGFLHDLGTDDWRF